MGNLYRVGSMPVRVLNRATKTARKSLSLSTLLFATLFVALIALSFRPLFLPELTTANTAACVPAPVGLISWWPGDGGASDISDGNDGSLGGGVTFVGGMVGQAFSLDGVDDYVHVLDGQGQALDGFSELTIEAWIWPDSLGWPNPDSGGHTAAILSKYDSRLANGISYSLQIENGKLRFVVLESLIPKSEIGVLSVADVAIGSWSHVAAVWRGGSSLDLYVNGAQVPTTFFSTGPTPTIAAGNNVPINIGRIESFSGTYQGPAGFFDGLIDEVALYNRGLSPSEIQTLYAAGVEGKCKNATTATATPTGPADNYLPMVVKPPPTPTPTATPRQPTGLVNGNFEGGPTGWGRYSSNGWPLILHESYLPVPARSGSWAAWLGGDYDEASILWQTVTIPVSDPTLRFWLWVASFDICGYDVAGVTINLSVAVDAFWLCAGNNTNGWVPRSVALNDYAGQTVEFEIAAFTDDTLNSNLFIDDVSLGASAGAFQRQDGVDDELTAVPATKLEWIGASGRSIPQGAGFDSGRLRELLSGRLEEGSGEARRFHKP